MMTPQEVEKTESWLRENHYELFGTHRWEKEVGGVMIKFYVTMQHTSVHFVKEVGDLIVDFRVRQFAEASQVPELVDKFVGMINKA